MSATQVVVIENIVFDATAFDTLQKLIANQKEREIDVRQQSILQVNAMISTADPHSIFLVDVGDVVMVVVGVVIAGHKRISPAK